MLAETCCSTNCITKRSNFAGLEILNILNTGIAVTQDGSNNIKTVLYLFNHIISTAEVVYLCCEIITVLRCAVLYQFYAQLPEESLQKTSRRVAARIGSIVLIIA